MITTPRRWPPWSGPARSSRWSWSTPPSPGSRRWTPSSTPSSTAASNAPGPRRRLSAWLPQATDSSPGRLAGVPFLVKDIACHQAGEPFHEGMRFLRDRQWRADERYAPGGPVPGRGPHHRRADEHPRARHRADDRTGRLRPHPQPLGPLPFARRVERRVGGRGGGRAGAGRPRQRRRRVDPDPGQRLRARRAEAVPGPRLARPRRLFHGAGRLRARRVPDGARLRRSSSTPSPAPCRAIPTWRRRRSARSGRRSAPSPAGSASACSPPLRAGWRSCIPSAWRPPRTPPGRSKPSATTSRSRIRRPSTCPTGLRTS